MLYSQHLIYGDRLANLIYVIVTVCASLRGILFFHIELKEVHNIVLLVVS